MFQEKKPDLLNSYLWLRQGGLSRSDIYPDIVTLVLRYLGSQGQPSSLDMSATTDPSNTDSKSVAINVSLSEGMTLSNLKRCCFNISYQIGLKCNPSSRDRILINLFNVQHINSERVSKFASTSRNLIWLPRLQIFCCFSNSQMSTIQCN